MASRAQVPPNLHKLGNETTDLWDEDFKRAMLRFGKLGKAIRENTKIEKLTYPDVDDCILRQDGSSSNIRKYEITQSFELTSKGASDFAKDIAVYNKDIVTNDAEENEIILFIMDTLTEIFSKGINNNKDYIAAVAASDSFEAFKLCKMFSASLSNVKNVLKRNNLYFSLKQAGLLEDFIKELWDRERTFI